MLMNQRQHITSPRLQLPLPPTACVAHPASSVKCRTENPVCSACSPLQARNDWTQRGRRGKLRRAESKASGTISQGVTAKETFLKAIKSEAAASYSEDLGKITHEDDNTNQCIFNVDRTAFCWKKMASRTFLAGEEKPALQSFKGQADALVRGYRS